MPIPAIIPAIVAAAGAIGGAGIQAASAKKNRESQERQNAIDRQRAATAYRTAVADMRAAGMNPITGQNPPQAASAPMPAPQSDMTGVAQVLQQGSSAIGDLLQRSEQALQDQSLNWYQGQVTSTNDMINNLQGIVKDYTTQMNQYFEGLTEDAKSYLKEESSKFISLSEKIDSIENSHLYSEEDLKSFGIITTKKDSNLKTTSDLDEYGGNIDFEFNFKDPVSTIVDAFTSSSSKEETRNRQGVTSSSSGTDGSSNTHSENKEGKRKGLNFEAHGNYQHKKSEDKTENHEEGETTEDRTSYATKRVSGKTVKNALRTQLQHEFETKLQDSGSQKINDSLKTIDKGSFVRLSRELIDSKLELKKHREYARLLRSEPGIAMKSYRGFVDVFKKNENPFVDRNNYADYQLNLQKDYNPESYPSVESFRDSHPLLYQVEKGLKEIKDPDKRERYLRDLEKQISDYFSDLEFKSSLRIVF